jgi:signal transduction histidine kinase
MKTLSLRLKMTLWYSISLLVVMSLMYTTIHFTLRETMTKSAESIVKAYSAQASSYIDAENGTVKLDENMPEAKEEVYFKIYNSANQTVYAYGVSDALGNIAPAFDKTRVLSVDGTKWILYDQKIDEDDSSIGWIRSVKSLKYIDDTLNNLLFIFLCLCPVFLAITLLTGYFLVRRTLRPIDKITTTALMIGRGDLSKRLNMRNTGDEVGRLSATFDEMIERLDTAFQAEQQFASDASHELRTPVTVISAYAENALNDDATKEEYARAMEVILKEGRKMSATISSLLMLTRGDQHRYQLNLEWIDLGQLVDDVTEEMETPAEEKGISISVLPHSAQLMKLDQTLITNLLLNILENAVKYSNPGGEVKVSLFKETDSIVLTIEDDGIGISQEDLPKVFNRFFRAEHTGEKEGTGLGLAIAKWIVELHQGEIHVESTLSTGTTVTIRLPMRRVNNSDII